MIKTLKMTGLNSVREHHNTSTWVTSQKHLDLQSVAKYNFDKLTKLTTPVARISAVHSGRNAKAATSDDAGGLDSVIFLARGAAVMLQTCNLWQEVGCAMVPPVLFKISSSILIASPLACPLQHLYSSHIIQAQPFCKQAVILSPFHHTYLNRKVVDSDCLDSNCHFGYDMQ